MTELLIAFDNGNTLSDNQREVALWLVNTIMVGV